MSLQDKKKRKVARQFIRQTLKLLVQIGPLSRPQKSLSLSIPALINFNFLLTPELKTYTGRKRRIYELIKCSSEEKYVPLFYP